MTGEDFALELHTKILVDDVTGLARLVKLAHGVLFTICNLVTVLTHSCCGWGVVHLRIPGNTEIEKSTK